jgi:hypothetical protein
MKPYTMFICWFIFTWLLLATVRNPPISAGIALVITFIAAASWEYIK